MKHPPPKQLAINLRRLADVLDQHGAAALDRAETYAARGYPAGGNGGPRSSDSTSSTERAALNPGSFDEIDRRVKARMRDVWVDATNLEGLICTLMAHASDEDQVTPGTGYCVCGCETFCSPRQNGPDDRLRSGLAPTCHRRFLRWRRETGDPTLTVADFRTAVRRESERATEEAQRLAELQATVRRVSGL